MRKYYLKKLVGTDDLKINCKGNDHELYFEEDDFDWFEKHLNQFDDIIYVHKTKEYPWGQRVVRFYDPDAALNMNEYKIF